MKLDPKTLRDLELFRTLDGMPGVFQTLDLTKTAGGHLALRFRFENPMSDRALLLQVQAGVQFLLDHDIRFELDPDMVREVKTYLDSPWDVASRAHGLRFFLESVTGAVQYRDLLTHARSGVQATRRLMGQVIPFLESILQESPPSEVQRPAGNLLALAERLGLAQVKPSRRPWVTFRADRYLRVEHKADFQRFFRLLSDLDALCAMAEAMAVHGLVLPEITESSEFLLEGEGIFHPFLQDPVPNPVHLGSELRVLFLTGPNMAGKTTYLKAVGVAAFLAHVGMGVPAARMRISPLDTIMSSLTPEENLRGGLSYFMAEVKRVREVAQTLAHGVRALVLFDEVFRGTNLHDAVEASRMVILGFSRCRGSGFLFSSHLTELEEPLRGETSVQFRCFAGDIRKDHAHYDFRLREGVSDQRLGLQLLEEQGVPALLESLSAAFQD